jgi:bis(5'-nucleosyl)-tetraphosphatase (symmetrical)
MSSEDDHWHMLHAGLPPQWSLEDAKLRAREAETALRGDDHQELLRRMYGDQPDRWDSSLRGVLRLRFIINSFTRLRYCSVDGRLDPDSKGAPGSQPEDLLPWFAVPGRRSANQNLLFGHWSTLGRVHWPEYRVWGLDTGCVWGAQLSALCLETGQIHAVECGQYRRPESGSN